MRSRATSPTTPSSCSAPCPEACAQGYPRRRPISCCQPSRPYFSRNGLFLASLNNLLAFEWSWAPSFLFSRSRLSGGCGYHLGILGKVGRAVANSLLYRSVSAMCSRAGRCSNMPVNALVRVTITHRNLSRRTTRILNTLTPTGVWHTAPVPTQKKAYSPKTSRGPPTILSHGRGTRPLQCTVSHADTQLPQTKCANEGHGRATQGLFGRLQWNPRSPVSVG